MGLIDPYSRGHSSDVTMTNPMFKTSEYKGKLGKIPASIKKNAFTLESLAPKQPNREKLDNFLKKYNKKSNNEQWYRNYFDRQLKKAGPIEKKVLLEEWEKFQNKDAFSKERQIRMSKFVQGDPSISDNMGQKRRPVKKNPVEYVDSDFFGGM